MSLEPLPTTAAWRHHDAREGHEVCFFSTVDGWTIAEGSTVAVEDGEPWIVSYRIEVDERWRSRRADITSHSRTGHSIVRLEGDGEGSWLLDGRPHRLLDGCLDVDLEASALTNTLPVHRFLSSESDRESAESRPAPAAFVRALDCSVERLEQTYRRIDDGFEGPRFDYAAEVFDVACVLSYDRSGLVIDYPGLAERAAPAS